MENSEEFAVLNLNMLVRDSIASKSLVLKEHEKYFIVGLQSEGILSDREPVRIQPANVVIAEYIRQFSILFSFEPSSDFKSTMLFYIQIHSHFHEAQDYEPDLEPMLIRILSTLIIESNQNCQVRYDGLDRIFNEEQLLERLPEFNQSYLKSLDSLKQTTAEFYAAIKFLSANLKNGNKYNIQHNLISQTVLNHSMTHPEEGEALVKLCAGDPDKDTVIFSPAICGLYNFHPKALDLVNEILKQNDNLVPILIAASSFSFNNEADARKVYELIVSIDSGDNSYTENLPPFFVNLLKNPVVNSEDLKKLCLDRINALLHHESSDVVLYTLQQLLYLKGFDNKIALMLEDLPVRQVNLNMLNTLNHLYAQLVNAESFFAFIKRYASIAKYQFKAKTFTYAISILTNQDPQNFSTGLINILIDDNGPIRFAGHRILREVVLNTRNRFRFKEDILQLTPVEQYKLWVSVLNNLMEPDSMIPLVLPIMDSSSSFVRTVFRGRIEYEVENFGRTIIEVLERELDLNNPDHIDFIEEIKGQLIKSRTYIAEKSAIKELNPKYTHANLKAKFDESYREKLHSGMEDEVSANSLLGHLASTVILAKGGGWKQDGRDSIAQLTSFETVFQLPRQAFIIPERIDYELRLFYITDWSKLFNNGK